MKKAVYIDMDGTLARFHDADKMFIEAMWTPGFYVNLKPFEEFVEAVKLFIKQNPDVDVYVLSAVLDTEPPFVVGEKNAWLDKYLPEIDKEHRIFTRAGEDKSDYIDMQACECFLIDDYNKNLYEFEAAGGTSIKFHNDVNHRGLGEFGGSKGNLWEGAIVHYDSSPEVTCMWLEGFTGQIKDFENYVIEDLIVEEYKGHEKNIIIPNGVQSISLNAFEKNDDIESVVCPGSVGIIYCGAFADCKNLKNVYFDKGLFNIANNAFAGCTSLEKVSLPASINKLDNQAFSCCDNLKEIVIDKNNQNYFSVDGVVYGTDGFEDYFHCCPAGYEGSLRLLGVTVGVGMDAFKGCAKLRNVELNNELKIIGENAFCDCTSLENIFIPGSVKDIHINAFAGCSSLKVIELPDGLERLGHGVFDGCKNLSEVVISDEALVRYCNEFNLLDEVFMTPCYEGLKARYEALIQGKDVDSLIEDANKRVDESNTGGKSFDRELE